MPSRRDFLRLLPAGYAAVLAGGAGSEARLEQAVLELDRAVLREYSTDFGNLIVRTPLVVAKPRTLPQLQNSFEYAQSRRLPVAFRGAGESFWGQSLCDRGMVIDLRGLSQPDAPVTLGPGRVTAPAGMRLRDLQKHLRERGLRLPVYTSSPAATLGGTLAAGGVSGRSFTRGLLARSVLEATVVGTDGTAWTCDAETNGDIFSLSVGTMGHAGALTQATIRTEALLPERVQLETVLPAEQLAALATRLSSVPAVAALEGYLLSDVRPLRAQVHATIEAKDPRDAAEKRLMWEDLRASLDIPAGTVRTFNIDSELQFSESLGGWNAWRYDLALKVINHSVTFFVISIAVCVAQEDFYRFFQELSLYAAGRPGYFTRPPYFALIRASRESEFDWVRQPGKESHAVGLDIFVSFRRDQLQGALEVMNAVTGIVGEFGGRLYPYAFLPAAGNISRLLPPASRKTRLVLDKVDPERRIRALFPLA